MPDQESWGVNITLTDGGIIRAKVESGHLAKYSDNASLLLDSNIIVDFYDKDEKHTSTLTSFRAEVNQSSNDMKASGNVIATSDSGITLFSESLTWLSVSEKLYTKDSIMITTIESDTIYGIGFESDSDLKNWKIIQPSGVTGKEYK
tara:strand:- start:934 stop:1374 length:441 start_codon:yes stop_codon:yes gene_type:complete